MRALPITRSLLTSLSVHLRNVTEHRSAIIRRLSSKNNDDVSVKVLQDNDNDEQKPKYRKKTLDYKQQINLRDITGKILGLKTRQEALQIAQKNNWVLVEDDLTKKVPTFKLVDPRQNLINEEVQEIQVEHERDHPKDGKPSGSKLHSQPSHKFSLFSSKISEHDLNVKINQIKKWVSRGDETKVRVNASRGNTIEKLRFIERQFEKNFNSPQFGVKINQKRLTPEELILTIVPFDKLLAQNLYTPTVSSGKSVDDDIDPNKLLAGELDQINQEKK